MPVALLEPVPVELLEPVPVELLEPVPVALIEGVPVALVDDEPVAAAELVVEAVVDGLGATSHGCSTTSPPPLPPQPKHDW